MNTPNPQPQSPEPMDQGMVLGILSYLGPLFIISLALGAGNQFVKFHAKQGLALFIVEVVVWIVSIFFWMLWPIYEIINLLVLVLIILGIINVVQKQEKELPVVGQLARSFKI